MLFSSFLIIAGAAVVSGTPVSRQENLCYPNAMGAGVSLISMQYGRVPYMELGTSFTPTPGLGLVGHSFRTSTTGPITPAWITADWHLQQNGQDPPSYIIK